VVFKKIVFQFAAKIYMPLSLEARYYDARAHYFSPLEDGLFLLQFSQLRY